MKEQPNATDAVDSRSMRKVQYDPIEIISTPVRLGLVTAVAVSIGGLAWTIFAKIPIYVNGYAYLIESGNQRGIPTKAEGELNYLIGSETPQPQTQLPLLNLLYEIGQTSKPVQPEQVVYAAAQILNNQIKPPQVNIGQNFRRELHKGQALAWIDSSLQRDQLNAAYLKRSLAKTKLEGVQDETARLNKALIKKKEILTQQLMYETKFLDEIRALNKILYASEARLLAQQSKVNEIQSLILEIDEKVAQNTNQVVDAKVQYGNSNVQLRSQTQEYIDRCLVFARRSLYVDRLYFPQMSRVERGEVIMSVSISEEQFLNSGIAGFMAERNAQQAGKGMPALLTPLGMDKAQYGGIIGEVVDVNQMPVSELEISTVIGSDALAQDLKQLIDNPVLLKVKLDRQDNPKRLNEAGFKWSSRGAKPFAVRTGDILSLQVTTRRISPISLFIPWLRRVSGISSPEILDKR